MKFFLRGGAEVGNEAAPVARKITALREQHTQVIREQMGQRSGTATPSLEQLFYHPVINVRTVEQMTGLSFANANTLIADLEALGIRKEITGQKRNRRCAYAPYLALLTDDTAPFLQGRDLAFGNRTVNP